MPGPPRALAAGRWFAVWAIIHRRSGEGKVKLGLIITCLDADEKMDLVAFIQAKMLQRSSVT